ncbi:MAG: hypothetical protein J6A15_07030 [Clostridia bacterium]|nr:hypothetical protein [Clostridia bacterium]
MIIYDDVKKNTKIAIFSKQDDILDEVINKLEEDNFNIEIYEDIDKLKNSIIRKKTRIVVFIKYDVEKINYIKEASSDAMIILYAPTVTKALYKEVKPLNIQNVVDLDRLDDEIMYSLRIIAQEESIDFEKFKLDIVGNLVESISHQIQANLLLIGASLDVIKMLTDDEKITGNSEKKDVMESLYSKNNNSLQKANMLLQLMSDATNISSESIMQYEDIIEIIKLIIDEFIKENNVVLNVNKKIKNASYICGPLNDVIFIICKIIKQIGADGIKNIELSTREDEDKWYFDIKTDAEIKNSEKILQINKYIAYIKNVKSKILDKKIIIEIKKIK